MIARCKGISCSLKESCYRWLLPDSDDPNDYIQSLYSPLHCDCRNYWKVRKAVDTASADRHANMLNNMIDRLNRE